MKQCPRLRGQYINRTLLYTTYLYSFMEEHTLITYITVKKKLRENYEP